MSFAAARRLFFPFTLLALTALAVACDESPLRSSFPAQPAKAVDADGDGYLPPEDCLDVGYEWVSQQPYCDENAPVSFAPHDSANAKDFAFTEFDGTYHIVHNRGFGSWTAGDNEIDFGHETSTDLIHWTPEPIIDLRQGPGSWNDRHLWAPQIHRAGFYYHMFFTGVTYTDDPALNEQRIGRAWSFDMNNWFLTVNRCDGVTGQGCALDCDAPWTSWGSGLPWESNCRDPFVIGYNGLFVMFLSTSLTNGKGVIARAVATDVRDWLMVDYIPFTEAGIAESPSVMLVDGTYYMFWSKNDGIHYATAEDPLGAWTYGGFVVQGFANELLEFDNGAGTVFPYVNDDFDVQFSRLLWDVGMPGLSNIASPVCQLPAIAVNPMAEDPRNGVDDNCDGWIDSVGPPTEPGSGRKVSPRFAPLGDRFP